MNEPRGASGWIVLLSIAAFTIWLVISFWHYFLVAGLVGFALWLIRAAIRWWVLAGRTTYQVNRALQRNDAAYLRARERMYRIARDWKRP
jgi:hypothetical protein